MQGFGGRLGLDTSDRARTHPLTPSQQTFWALAEILPDSSIGNEGLILRMRGPLRRDALQHGIASLARRYDAWRTVIEIERDDLSAKPTARVETLDPFPVEEIDLSAHPPAERAQLVDALVRERLMSRIDLAVGPAMRVSLFRGGPEEHLLLFVSQHAAFDGLSFFDVLPRRLASAYTAQVRGEPEADTRAAPFADFARAQARVLAQPDRPTLAWWKECLAGASAALELPRDRARAERRTGRGLRRSFDVDAPLRTSLVSRADELGVSLSDLLLTAFSAQLRRYSGQTDLLIGVPHGNRTEPGSDGLFGCAMITLPLRLDLRACSSLWELAQHVRSRKREAFANLDPGVDEILRQSLSREARESGSGYRAVFSYARLGLRGLHFEGLDVEAERPDPGWTAVDLSLDVSDSGDALVCTVEADLDLFDPETVELCLAHYVNLLRDVAARGDVAISDLAMLTPEEQPEARERSRSFAYPRDLCLHQALAMRAPTESGAIAAVCRGRELTYLDLRSRARQLAAHLNAAGARPGERVALVLDDPMLALVGMLGTLKSGAAFVPLDASLPPARIRSMLQVCRPCAIVTERGLTGETPDVRIPVLYVDDLPASLPIDSAGYTTLEPGAGDPAYVIFTSGSTGQPKGVVVSHRNVVSQLYARLNGYPEPPRRLITAHSFVFDASLAGVFWTLASGGLLVLPDSDQRRDPVSLRRLVNLHRVTHLDVPPVLHRELLEGLDNDDLSSLEAVIVGGEACPTGLVLRHQEVLPRAQLFNEYGPTETTIYSTVYAVPRFEAPATNVPIGRPIANTRCYVLDANRGPLPRGVSGELYIGGDGVALGYLNEPELTAERFLADPFAPEPGARMYRTGDLVRLRRDGELEFLGRLDRQVRVRGYRVELGEVEAALLTCPGVSAAVAAVQRDAGGAHIVAWVVPAPGAKLTAAEIRTRLCDQLPTYMIPSHVSPIPSIPLTTAGKLDAERLPPPQRDALADDGPTPGYIDPRTQSEFRISEIWAELLGQPRVGANDDFFDLGGHSLLAVRMLNLVSSILGVRVSLSAFVRAPTVAGLAGLMRQLGNVREESLMVPIQPHGTRKPFWVIHPVGGHVVFMKRMIRHLPSDLPLLGIQAQGLDGHREPLQTVEEMARLYTSLIRAEQPSGPYFIGGHSMGGLVALEIAQQLRAAGETIGLVAIIDAPGPGFPRTLPLPLRILDRLRFLLRAKWRARAASDGMTEYLSYVPFSGEAPRDTFSDAISRVSIANSHAADVYKPRFYPGRIHLFRAMRTPDWPGLRFDDPLSGWGPYASEVVVVPIDSGHVEMLDEPALTLLGKALGTALDDAAQQAAAVRA